MGDFRDELIVHSRENCKIALFTANSLTAVIKIQMLLRVAKRTRMYKIAPVLTEYVIEDPKTGS